MAIERYHGSTSRALVYGLFKPISVRLRPFFKRWFRPEKEVSPEVAALLRRAVAFSDQGDLAGALACAREAADVVGRTGGATWDVGAALVRLGDCRRGLALMAPALRLGPGDGEEWAGQDLAGRHLVVMQRTRSDMGGPIRLARFIASAEARADRVTVVVEPRLVPLFRRTFRRSQVRPLEGRGVPTVAADALVTSFEGLAADCVTDWASIAAAFVPLVADTALVAEFRQRYHAASPGPVVGITWGSRNSRKEVPDLASWTRFIRDFPATFVSLQYGAADAALGKLRGVNPAKLIDDETVDQLVDMDRFAAQIGSLDAVIAISNTATHLAGAMSIPSVMVGDDKFRGQYPMTGRASGWYPRGVLVRRNRRPWRTVMDEAADRLRGILATRSRTDTP